ncbi:MAG: hypothetical protein C4547_09055 [Phycisphaerales bacterium]|nr:MAG: hypothetical protein C4547_09055 [Phycisphaerales bacterium]
MSDRTIHTLPPLRERLSGQHVLITGSTGFLAKVFVEKILRCVDTVAGLHLVIRPRSDGRSPRQRLVQDVLGSSAFDRLRAMYGDRFEHLCEEKLHVVGADLTRDRLGLSDDAYAALADRITLVVNSAATVTFDERLDLAIELNAFGPRRLVQLAQDAGHAPMMHVSTCYVAGTRVGRIPEGFDAPQEARDKLPRLPGGEFDLDAIVADLRRRCAEVSARHDGESERLRRDLIEVGMSSAREYGWNDTYTFTKWLGEQIVRRDRGEVPLAIFRPAIIESAYEDPAPGWIDGLRMADPMIVAYGRGKLLEFAASEGQVMDLIPVDFVANAMLAALPIGMEAPDGDVPVYHCASSASHPLTFTELTGRLREAFVRRPMIDEDGEPIVPRPLNVIPSNEFLARWQRRLARVERLKKLCSVVGITGAAARRLSASRRSIEQLLYFAKIYLPYTHLNFQFEDDRMRGLLERLHPEDRRTLDFDVKRIDWADYVTERHVPGLRSFVLGTGAEPSARLMEAGFGPLTESECGAALHGRTLFEVFKLAVEAFGPRSALQILRNGKWTRYTFNEAYRATGTIMRRFVERGLQVGDRVALSAENGPEWGLTYLAMMRAGLTAVPLDPQLPPQDAWAAARFAHCKLLCAGQATCDALAAQRSDTDPGLVRLGESFIPPPAASREDGPEPAPVTAGQLASILFTSGTTVAPKAVKLTHRNLISNARAMIERHPVRPGDQLLSVLPLYHVFEFTGGFLAPLACGATITYVGQLKSPDILAALKATGTTIMLVVPRMLRMFHDSIVREVEAGGALKRTAFRLLGRLSEWTGGRYGRTLFGAVHRQFGGRLRMFVSGGSALDPELCLSFGRMGFRVCEGYGLTETSPVIAVTPADDVRPGSVGPPLSNVDVEIRHQNLEGIGELWVRGPSVTSGYLYNQEATDEILVDGWLRTGDLGHQDGDGFLYLTGRAKDLIVTSAGKNVYPDEVEYRYRDLPHVKELCVLAMPASDGLGDEVHAVAVIDPAAEPELDRSYVEREVRQAAGEIAETLPSHQRISTFHFWERELPKTSTLKAKRGIIRNMLLSRGEAAPPSQPGARDHAVHTVKNAVAFRCIRSILSRISRHPADAIAPHMHLLLDLGIDSIARLEVISDVEAHFKLRINEKTAAELVRVSDLIALVGDRKPIANAKRDRALMRQTILSNGRTEPVNGHLPAPLKPVRWAVRGGAALLMKTYVRVDVYGRQNVPGAGAFILAPNHSSHLDSPAVIEAVGGRRRVWIAAAEDYFFDSALKRFLYGKVFDSIPFDRHADGVQGLRRCAEALRRGDGLLIFPEGTRSISGKMQPFKIGTAVLAAEAGVPIVPVHIARAWELFPKGHRIPRPGTVIVRFGEPVPPPDLSDAQVDRYAAYCAFTERVEQAVRGLEAQSCGA